MQTRALSGLFLMACCIRLGYVVLDVPVPPQDTADYDELALNVLQGVGYVSYENWYGFPMYSWRPPAYPLFLAAIYAVWGYSHAAVQVVQAVIGALSVVLLFLIVWRMYRSAAWPAAVVAALYEPLVSVCSEVMSECFFTFFILLALWAIRDDRQRWQMFVLSGVAIGFAALTRPVGLLILPAFVLAALCERGWTGWRGVAWVGLATIVVMLPWTVRNAAVHGAFVPVSTHGGFIVARSNALEPAWRQERGWGIDRAVFEAMPTEVERDRFWWKQGREFILSHPLAYGRLAFERLLRFLYFFRPSYNAAFAAVLPFALLGLWRYGRRPEFRVESAFIGISTLVFCMLLYGSTRFRLPLEPLLIGFAAVYLSDAWSRWSHSVWGSVVSGVLLLNLGLWLMGEQLRSIVLYGLNGLGLR